MDSSVLDDSEHSDLFASPSKIGRTETQGKGKEPERPKTPANQGTRFDAEDAEEAREAALQRELEGVRNINEVIEGVIATLERAKCNMGTVSKTVNNASTLLNSWTRILSQTEHNQRLLLNPNWNGASQDLEDMEKEAQAKQQAAERRAVEEERRREEVRRRLEEEEQRRLAAASTPAPTRGAPRGRGKGRASSSGYGRGGAGSVYSTADNTASSIGSGRSASGIGRGFGASRAGRSRGGGATR